MSIRVVKLISGEEIIADITGINKVMNEEVMEDEIILDKPMSLHLVTVEQGIGIQLMPWPIFSEKKTGVLLGKEHVMFFVEPSTGVRNQYAEMVGLPVVPDDNIIVPEGISNIKLSN